MGKPINMVREKVVREFVPDLQLSDEYVKELEQYMRMIVLRSADRCRKNQRKRLLKQDV